MQGCFYFCLEQSQGKKSWRAGIDPVWTLSILFPKPIYLKKKIRTGTGTRTRTDKVDDKVDDKAASGPCQDGQGHRLCR
jgi:hypothetical protein